MSSSISHEEFHRLQTQLLDLRTANYTLMEESNRYKNEAKNTILKLDSLEKEYQKAQRALDKSRKAKDVEMLFAENDALQNKLISQEEQFREQNQALLQELANLVAANEKLEAAVKYQQGDHEVSDANSQCDLSTEFYEKLLFEEKQRFDLLNEELCLKTSQITELTTSLNETKSNLDAEVNGLKRNISILQMEADKVEHLTQQLKSNVEEKNAINDEFNQLKEKIEEMKHSFQQEISQLLESHKMEIERQRAIHSEEMKQYEIQIELAAAQRAEFEDEAIRARQEAQDAQEDVRISERRILSVTADLRRQLRGERRRADKLQERLRDVASDNSSTLPKADASLDHDNCSVSSWSLMSGQNDASATPSSPFPPTDSPSSGSEKNGSRSEGEQPPDLTNENARLVNRLATMQQEKWRLEERVLHLEETNAAMADEMVKRGKLIQHYCMEGRSSPAKPESSSISLSPGSEKLSVRRMVSLIRQIGGDAEGDTDSQQRRLRRMLEETLTKNMHLQEDIERLSQEVVRLSQIVGAHHLPSCHVETAAVMNSA
ncbi:GRIP1-associated protein 1-like [Daphnia pulex]|uniref:GRIP1-associated protein 1-like n=1 Tax=Daphnia pulex TaxID=6669 RepID=UPI001EDE6A8E|nr:GRIP1-associated protein 1-like [Daphnia pulex]XP_046450006.1 GRIP1-associated protein 1-like [Daphnia pulex]